MRRAFVMIVVLSVLAPAHAQNGSPDVTSLTFPLLLTTTLERQTEHGCSQSFESVSATATLTLRIDRGGAARLSLDGTILENMGPSPGRYMAGDHEFSRLTELQQSTFVGTATSTPGGIAITFDHVDAAEITISGWGTLPLPPATSSAVAAQLRCTVARTDVLPSEPVAGEQPVSMSLAACAWVGAAPSPFDRYDASFVLGAGRGVRDLSSQTMFSYSRAHEIRLPH